MRPSGDATIAVKARRATQFAQGSLKLRFREGLGGGVSPTKRSLMALFNSIASRRRRIPTTRLWRPSVEGPSEGEARGLVLGSGLFVGTAAPRAHNRRACLSDLWTAKILGKNRTLDRRSAARLIVFVAIVALASAVYLGLEAAAWALLYLWLGASPAWQAAVLYSLGAMTAYGHAPIFLEEGWRC